MFQTPVMSWVVEARKDAIGRQSFATVLGYLASTGAELHPNSHEMTPMEAVRALEELDREVDRLIELIKKQYLLG